MHAASAPSLRHLHVFATVAQLRNVRKAAETLHVSQPAVTQSLAKLESQVDAVLFERRASGTYLTPAGEILSARVGRMFEQIVSALEGFGVAVERGKTLAAVAERITRSHIRALVAIADNQLATDAGQIGVSEISIHRVARELERSLGRTLIGRDANGIVATAAGRELAHKLSLALREIEWGIEEIRAAAGERGGELRIGTMPMAGSVLVAPVLNLLLTQFPQARIQVRTRAHNDMIEALRAGEIDCVVGLLPEAVYTDELAVEPLLRSHYVLVARRNHPLTEKTTITAADLAGYEWITPDQRATRHAAFDRLFAAMPGGHPGRIEAFSASAIGLLLSGSDRLTLLTQFEYEHEKVSGALTALAFGPIEPTHAAGITCRANWLPTGLYLKFMELLREHAASVAKTGLDGEATQ